MSWRSGAPSALVPTGLLAGPPTAHECSANALLPLLLQLKPEPSDPAASSASSAPEDSLQEAPSSLQPGALPANASLEEVLDHALVTATLEVGARSLEGCCRGCELQGL